MAGDSDTGDLLMMVIPIQGQRAVEGESTSALTSTSPLMNGFKPGFLFEISNFKFAIQTLKKDTDEEKKAKAAGQPVDKTATNTKTGKSGEPESCPVQPVTFERPIDRSSPILLKHCVNCTTLYGAVVVKRKPAGGLAAGEPFLRLEFIGVLFTSVQWSNADPVTENCTFIARAVNVQYRPQLPDGTLGATCIGYWSRIPNQNQALSF